MNTVIQRESLINLLSEYMKIEGENFDQNAPDDADPVITNTGPKEESGPWATLYKDTFEGYGHVVKYNWKTIDAPSARTARYMTNPDGIKSEFVKQGGYGQHPTASHLVEFAKKFYFMRQGNDERVERVVENFDMECYINAGMFPNQQEIDDVVSAVNTELHMLESNGEIPIFS
jgi:hypothetical protein